MGPINNTIATTTPIPLTSFQTTTKNGFLISCNASSMKRIEYDLSEVDMSYIYRNEYVVIAGCIVAENGTLTGEGPRCRFTQYPGVVAARYVVPVRKGWCCDSFEWKDVTI